MTIHKLATRLCKHLKLCAEQPENKNIDKKALDFAKNFNVEDMMSILNNKLARERHPESLIEDDMALEKLANSTLGSLLANWYAVPFRVELSSAEELPKPDPYKDLIGKSAILEAPGVKVLAKKITEVQPGAEGMVLRGDIRVAYDNNPEMLVWYDSFTLSNKKKFRLVEVTEL